MDKVIAEIMIGTTPMYFMYDAGADFDNPDTTFQPFKTLQEATDYCASNSLKYEYLPNSQIRESMAKDQVESLTFGGFRKFWQEANIVITPELSGVFNVEGGYCGLSTQWFQSECAHGGAEGAVIVCSDCGRGAGNYLQLKSGMGDGVYATWSLTFDNNHAGCFVIFDEAFEEVRDLDEIREQVAELSESIINGKSHDLNASINIWNQKVTEKFYGWLGDLDPNLVMDYVGKLNSKEHFTKNQGRILIGDSMAEADSQYAILGIDVQSGADYFVYSFSYREDPAALRLRIQRAERSGNQNELVGLQAALSVWETSDALKQNPQGILVPKAMLVLHSDLAKQINLAPSRFAEINWQLESESQLYHFGAGHAQHMGEPAVRFNMNLYQFYCMVQDILKAQGKDHPTTAQRFHIEWLSWVSMLTLYLQNPDVSAQVETLLTATAESHQINRELRGQFTNPFPWRA